MPSSEYSNWSEIYNSRYLKLHWLLYNQGEMNVEHPQTAQHPEWWWAQGA